MATAQTPALEPIFEEHFEKNEIVVQRPSVPDSLKMTFIKQMRPLRRLEQFKPFLAEYNLDGPDPEAA